METWYKVVLSFEQSTIGGKGWTLQNDFGELYITAGPARKQAMMLTNDDGNYEQCIYYFSPAAYRIARRLINSYGGVSCSMPEGKSVAMLVGDAADWNDFLRAGK